MSYAKLHADFVAKMIITILLSTRTESVIASGLRMKLHQRLRSFVMTLVILFNLVVLKHVDFVIHFLIPLLLHYTVYY